jgi:hypothetical protein
MYYCNSGHIAHIIIFCAIGYNLIKSYQSFEIIFVTGTVIKKQIIIIITIRYCYDLK